MFKHILTIIVLLLLPAACGGPTPATQPVRSTEQPGAGGYGQHVASFQDQARAEAEVRRLKNSGRPATVRAELVLGQTWYRVYAETGVANPTGPASGSQAPLGPPSVAPALVAAAPAPVPVSKSPPAQAQTIPVPAAAGISAPRADEPPFPVPPGGWAMSGRTYEQTMNAVADLKSKNRLSQAVDQLKTLDRIAPNDYYVNVWMGSLDYLRDDYDLATERYQRGANLKPREIEPLQGLMLSYRAKSNHLAVISTGLTALKLGEKIRLRSQVAQAYYQLGDFQTAVWDYQKYLRQYPREAEARTGLGWAYLKLGERGRAGREFDAALRLNPGDESARDGLRASGGL